MNVGRRLVRVCECRCLLGLADHLAEAGAHAREQPPPSRRVRLGSSVAIFVLEVGLEASGAPAG